MNERVGHKVNDREPRLRDGPYVTGGPAGVALVPQ